MRTVYNEVSAYMPKKTVTKETVAAPPVLAAKTKAPRTAPVVAAASSPRVKSVKHSKSAAPVVTGMATGMAAATVAVNAHDRIAQIAYGYWEARGFQPGSPEQDWLRAEREYLQLA